MNIKGKIAVVTGAKGGIGSVLVRRLLGEGVECIEVDKNIKFPIFGTFNFARPRSTEGFANYVKSNYGSIDFLFNVAGVGIYAPIDELDYKQWSDSININLTAPFVLTKELLPLLERSKNPMVLNVGSGMGVLPKADRTAYCSSKFGLRGLSLSLNKELKNVDVCLLTLGSVMTNFGTGGIRKRQELEKAGKKYLTSSEVVSKIIDIAKSDKRKGEYTFYPKGYEK